jgi:hypothetical protein
MLTNIESKCHAAVRNSWRDFTYIDSIGSAVIRNGWREFTYLDLTA